MKSHRSALLGLVLGASVLTAAACEPKTTVVIPPDAVSVVSSPDAITLEVGQTQLLVAQVLGGDATTARTVAWTSSNTNVATVDGNGLVTAVAVGVTTVTATATADANARDATAVTVVAQGGGGAPPTISIKSITFGNLLTPVNPDNVFGQIDVTLNVDVPVGAQVTRVEVLINGEEVCNQAFSGAAAIGVTSASELGPQADPVEIVCSINTAAFDAAGVPTWPNATYELTAQLIQPDGNVIATPSRKLVFNNINFINVVLDADAANTFEAVGGNGPRSLAPGILWHGGDLVFSLLSVNYGPTSGATNQNLATATITITSNGSGVHGLVGCRTVTAANATNNVAADPTVSLTDGGAGGPNFPFCGPQFASQMLTTPPPSGTFQIVFSADDDMDDSSPGVENVEDLFRVTVASTTLGGQAGPVCINPDPTLNPQVLGCGLVNATFPNNNQIPVDNLAPRVTQLNILRPNQYFNAGFVPRHSTGGPNCGATNCPATSPFARTVDYGVDSQTATFMAGLTGALVDVTAGFTPLPETQTSNTNVFALTTTDALTNSRQVYATTTNTVTANSATNAAVVALIALFGIDNTLPTQTVAGPPDQSSNCPAAPSDPTTCAGQNGWTVSFSDAGVGPSGFNVNPVSVKLERILASGTTCHNPNTGAAISCTTNSGIVADDGVITLPALDGYYRLTTFVTDAANNRSTQTVILTLRDYLAPVAGGISSPASIAGGAAVTFSSALIDNVELGDVLGATVFGASGVVLVDSRQTIGTYGVTPIVDTNPGTFNIASFVRSMEGTQPNGLPTGGVFPATAFEYAARDVAGVEVNNIIADGCPPAGAADGSTTQNCILRNVNISAAVNLGSNNVFPAFTDLAASNGANGLHGLFAMQAPTATTVCTDGSCSPSSVPASTTLSATLTGPAATFANPFSRVVFVLVDANGRYTPIGTASVSVTDNTVLNTRTYTFSFVWTPTGLPNYAAPIRAIGVAGGVNINSDAVTNDAGSALLSQPVTVTLTNT